MIIKKGSMDTLDKNIIMIVEEKRSKLCKRHYVILTKSLVL